MSSRNDAALRQSPPRGEDAKQKRTQSGTRRAVVPSAVEAVHIPGLPTPAELQIAAQQRLTPLSPRLVVHARNIPSAPRPFLPPQSVRRAFISQMQADEPPRAPVWPWLVIAFVLSAAGVALGLFGLGILPYRR